MIIPNTIKELFPRFVKDSPFATNVFTLAGGTAVSQLIPLAISPFLTRMFEPEIFGLFSLYFSILMVSSVFATGKYEMAIIIPSEDKEARAVFDLSIILSFISSSGLFIVLLITKDFFLAAVNAEALGYQVLLVAPGLLAVGLAQSYHYYLNRQSLYKLMSGVRIIRSIGYSIFALVGGLFKFGPTLITADVFGHLCSVIFATRKISSEKFTFSSFTQLARVAKKYSNFPKYLIVSGLLEKGSGQLPVFVLINLFHSLPAAGFFSFAQRIIIAPADLISRAIGDVFRQKASEQYNRFGECEELFRSTCKRLVLIGAIPFLVAFLLAEDAFALMFGSEWREAGTYARIMMPLFFMQFVVSPLSSMFVIANKQRFDLGMQIALFTLTAISLIIGKYYFNEIRYALTLLTVVYCLKYAVEFFLAYKFSKKHD